MLRDHLGTNLVLCRLGLEGERCLSLFQILSLREHPHIAHFQCLLAKVGLFPEMIVK